MNFSDLVGKVLVEYEKRNDDEELRFTDIDGNKYVMYHYQDCCEHVYIESIVGDLDDIMMSPILVAEVVSNSSDPAPADEYQGDSYTWTFYKLSTIKGSVTIRWYGSSNGYYSESVSFEQIT